jgi:hypothetical protein
MAEQATEIDTVEEVDQALHFASARVRDPKTSWFIDNLLDLRNDLTRSRAMADA